MLNLVQTASKMTSHLAELKAFLTANGEVSVPEALLSVAQTSRVVNTVLESPLKLFF